MKSIHRSRLKTKKSSYTSVRKIQWKTIFYVLTWRDFLKTDLSIRIGLFKQIVMEGREFRGSSDDKMRRLWLGRENDETVARTRNFFSQLSSHLSTVNHKKQLEITKTMSGNKNVLEILEIIIIIWNEMVMFLNTCTCSQTCPLKY